jgi:hypothetical protein
MHQSPVTPGHYNQESKPSPFHSGSIIDQSIIIHVPVHFTIFFGKLGTTIPSTFRTIRIAKLLASVYTFFSFFRIYI